MNKDEEHYILGKACCQIEDSENCDHSWIDADNEGVYGVEKCRLCGKKKDKN